ncbi:MAG: Sulfurtransferase TusA family protein [Chloroflexi bacterium]|nr:Sulfurtransferase TusA family protein [Chloroflexota bacterium]
MPHEQAPVHSDQLLDACGLANVCSDLTPLISKQMRRLDLNQILEVMTDDPIAREAVPAWSRLSGNQLVAILEEGAQNTRFYLRRS